MSAIADVLWPGCKAEVGDDLVFAGIYANKSGYHNTRNNHLKNRPNDYSIQLDIDRQGPGDQGAAIDMTFKSAQRGDYRNIAKYSQRLYQAGAAKDPRTYPMREFYGNTDGDTEVEGWSYYRGRPGSSDSSHLWHIHISIHRKYINDEAAMRSILEIFTGESDLPTPEDVWNVDYIPAPKNDPSPNPNNPTWKPKSYLQETLDAIYALQKDVAEIKAKLS